MFKKLTVLSTFIYSIAGYATEYDGAFYVTPKLDFVSQLDSKENDNFGLGYALDIGVPIYKLFSIENTIRYIDWNSQQFKSNFLQYGTLLKLNFPFTDRTNFALSGGFLADLDIGNEARDKEVNPYVKIDVDYHINKNWSVVLGFNQSFSSNYLDQYAYSLGMKYKFYTENKIIESKPLCDCIVTEEKIEVTLQDIHEEEKVVKPIIEQEQKVKTIISDSTPTIDYDIKKGDFIHKICRKFNMSIDEFIRINKEQFSGRNLNYVYPGETVKVKSNQK
ncbi:outer membrane beta-barrel protein [Vibrio vulnificus]|uniref:outer membrane beta-barrel protein n=1 Tax=Vibrio vulnificus TaxID=672 RepID=UPI001594646E|nr:LysM peptidoglycan-binding domain-containing protein [Vibrio vulnificus]EJE8554913.1 LysM peptidoglycan-binding domain-containing protein [Vibrio vulnificus]NVD21482.1 LysM peptidoglycan-binding domain-containing protein [Vibrio vulnificus]